MFPLHNPNELVGLREASGFLDGLTENLGPIVANAGLTYRS
jgi:hypothetical protein